MTDGSGTHAVITGGGTGIGAAIAREFDRAGIAVSLMARDRDRLDVLAGQLKIARAIKVDVADEASVHNAFAEAVEHFGSVGILVNNAGIAPTGPLTKTSLAEWEKVISVNLTGAFLCSRTVVPDMVQAGQGRIINIASTAGLKAYAYTAAYVASKHGLVGLTRALAVELARKGVTVNAICPGFTDTDIVSRSIDTIVEKTGRSRSEALSELVKANPQKRLIDPEEVAATVYWLCSNSARSITGQSIAIAGGEVM